MLNRAVTPLLTTGMFVALVRPASNVKSGPSSAVYVTPASVKTPSVVGT